MKTLEDIEEELEEWYDRTTTDYIIDGIRQAAREWITHLRTECDNISLYNPLRRNYYGKINWIKEFFNLEDKE